MPAQDQPLDPPPPTPCLLNMPTTQLKPPPWCSTSAPTYPPWCSTLPQPLPGPKFNSLTACGTRPGGSCSRAPAPAPAFPLHCYQQRTAEPIPYRSPSATVDTIFTTSATPTDLHSSAATTIPTPPPPPPPRLRCTSSRSCWPPRSHYHLLPLPLFTQVSSPPALALRARHICGNATPCFH